MNKSIKLFSIATLLLSSSLVNAMYEAPADKMWRGVKSNDPIVMQEAYEDFVGNRINCDTSIFLNNNYDENLDHQQDNYLIYASRFGYISVIEKLIELGIKLKVKNENNQGARAFIIAVVKGNVEIVEALLKAGVDIDATNEYKETALSDESKLDMVRLLVNKGASITKKNDNGSTAIDLARMRWRTKIANFLQEQLILKRDVITKELSEYFPRGIDKMITEYVD